MYYVQETDYDVHKKNNILCSVQFNGDSDYFKTDHYDVIVSNFNFNAYKCPYYIEHFYRSSNRRLCYTGVSTGP